MLFNKLDLIALTEEKFEIMPLFLKRNISIITNT
jgi:hypothetical protein